MGLHRKCKNLYAGFTICRESDVRAKRYPDESKRDAATVTRVGDLTVLEFANNLRVASEMFCLTCAEMTWVRGSTAG